MDKVKDEHFNITSWSSIGALDYGGSLPDYVQYEERGKNKVLLREGFCGSTACVLGQAGLIKEFNEQGLYIELSGSGRNSAFGMATMLYVEPETDVEYTGVYAGQRFFDLPMSVAELLFYVNDEEATVNFYLGGARDGVRYREEDADSITPKHVAAALRKLVETDGASATPYLGQDED